MKINLNTKSANVLTLYFLYKLFSGISRFIAFFTMTVQP